MEAQPIQSLSRELISKIAAGEVIGAPFNVIKELLENSIDAAADQIEITIENGGYSLMRIRDDGTGIRRVDMPKACQRHTTSKLSKYNDLEKIGTFGFRGEALASMSCCAHVTITTKTFQEKTGYSADYENEEMVSQLRETAMNEGTVVEVKDLFYNDHKRLASRGKATTDTKNICDVVTKYAIAYPNVSFILIANNKELLHTYGQSTSEEVLRLLFNIEDAKSIFNLTTTPCVNVSANCFLSAPSFTAKKRVCAFFINGRLVSCTTLKKAIEDAYNDCVGPTLRPFYVVILRMPQENIDVNIHPQKQTVKFLNEIEIAQEMNSTIKEALNSRRHSRPVVPMKEKKPSSSSSKSSTIKQVSQNSQITQFMTSSSSTTKSGQESPSMQTKLTPLDQARLALGLPLTQETQQKIEEEQENGQNQQTITEQPLLSSTTRVEANETEEHLHIPPQKQVELGESDFNGDNELNLPIPPAFSSVDKPIEEEEGVIVPPIDESNSNAIQNDQEEEQQQKPIIQGADEDDDEEKIIPFKLPKVPSSVRRLASQTDAPKKSKSSSTPRSTLFEELKYAPKQKIAEDMGMRTLEQMFTPPTIIAKPYRNVELKSILQMRVNILENESKSLTDVLKKSHYVGFVGLKNLLLQSGDALYLCNTFGLLKDLFVHKILNLFQNFPQYRLPHHLDIEQTVNVIGQDGKRVSEILTNNAALLLDYFSISIDKGILYSMPSIVTGYKPSYSTMPLFLNNIATRIDWEDEESCLANLIDEIAAVSSPIPQDETDEELSRRLMNEIMSCVLPELNEETYSASMDAGDSVVQISTVASLFQAFNP